jgi:hypothetical protein
MLPYFLIFLCFLIAAFKDSSNTQMGWYYFLFFAASIMTGIRDMIGGFDVYIYGEIYEVSTAVLLTFDPIEIGFRYLYAFLKLFNDNRHFMFFVMAFILFFFQFRIYKKYSPLLLLSLFIFFCKFFLMSFVYLRQGTAMGLVTLAIPYALNKKYIPYFIITITAFFIHKSSIFFLPFIFLANRNFSNLQMFIMIATTMIIAVTPLNNALFGFLAETSGDAKAEMYVNQSTGVNIFYFMELLVVAVILIAYKEEFYKTPTSRMIANGLLSYILVTLLSVTNASFIRFGWYYLPFFILGITYFISFQMNRTSLRLFKSVLLLYFSLLFFRLLILYDDGDLMPYKTVFEDYERGGKFEFMEYRDRLKKQ